MTVIKFEVKKVAFAGAGKKEDAYAAIRDAFAALADDLSESFFVPNEVVSAASVSKYMGKTYTKGSYKIRREQKELPKEEGKEKAKILTLGTTIWKKKVATDAPAE